MRDETWATIKTDEKRSEIFERKILWQLFNPSRDHNTGEHEIGTNQEVRDILGDTDIMGTMKSKRISWAGHLWRIYMDM